MGILNELSRETRERYKYFSKLNKAKAKKRLAAHQGRLSRYTDDGGRDLTPIQKKVAGAFRDDIRHEKDVIRKRKRGIAMAKRSLARESLDDLYESDERLRHLSPYERQKYEHYKSQARITARSNHPEAKRLAKQHHADAEQIVHDAIDRHLKKEGERQQRKRRANQRYGGTKGVARALLRGRSVHESFEFLNDLREIVDSMNEHELTTLGESMERLRRKDIERKAEAMAWRRL